MKRIFLAGLLALCLLASLPMVAFAVNAPGEEPGTSDTEPLPADETDEATALVACTATEGCTLEAGHAGDCVLTGQKTEPCTVTEGCTLEAGHVGDCILSSENAVNESIDPLAEDDVISVDTADAFVKAFKNARQDETTKIRVMADLELTEGLGSRGNIVLTSDGAHIITFSSMKEKGIGFNIYSGGSLTIGASGDDENVLAIVAESTAKIRCLVNCSNSFFVLNSGELKSSADSMTHGVACFTGKSKFTMNGGKINGDSKVRSVWLESSTFTMNEGEITKGKANNQGGGVYMTGTNPHFVMNGGSITQCEAAYNGGGVALMSNATFEMKDGIISGCTSNVGGGVYMKKNGKAPFVMGGGTITGCTAKYGGGGVYMEDSNRFTMNGGTISDCGRVEGETTISNGGGVYVTGETAVFTMMGTISNCKAPGNHGGGIYAKDATVTIDGSIDQCEAGNGGGVSGGGKAKLTMGKQGTITACKAEIYGGGVFVGGSEAELTMEGRAITNCTALQGGGVFFHIGKTFTLKAGEISDCTATGNMAKGGGVFLHKIETFSMSGGTISNNTAEYLGGGIYIGAEGNAPVGSYQITAGEISQNRVTDPYGFGGGIYAQKGITLNLENTLVTGNTASALGGGIWACRTGDIKIYVTDGGAVYGNDAQVDGSKTPSQAGDDIAFVASLGTTSTMTLYQRMLGGGFNHYYKDGGITWLPSGDDHTAGLGLGAPDGQTSRYGDSYMELCTDTENLTGFTALKNVVSAEAKASASSAAKLIVTGNYASRGGGIGTNGNLVIGTPDEETYSVTVKKAWSNDTPEEKKTAVSVYLKIGEEKLGPVTLNKENGWTASFTGLTDKPDKVKYAVAEDPVPEGFTPSYSEAAFNGMAGTIVVTNTYSPLPPAPKTGSLTVSKTVSGDGADHSKDFQFTVALADSTFAGPYGDMTFTEGKAVFTLKDGESKTAEGLPAGIGYTVTESDNAGYTVTKTGDAGNIPADQTAEAHFNNHKDRGSPDGDTVDVTVKKVWKLDDGGKAAELVTVALLQDGKLYATAELTGDNGWQHTWNGLDSRHNWTVEELNIPNDFTASTEKQGMTFTIINDDIPDAPPIDPIQPDVPDNPEPPHTGEFRYPVWLPILAAGALLAIIGIAGKKKHPGKYKS